MRFVYLIAAAALAACATPNAGALSVDRPEPVDAFALQIEVGRWGVMNDRVRDFTFDEERAAPVVEEDYSSPQSIARALRVAVWEHNALKAQLCSEGRFTALTCTTALTPAWLAEAPNAAPSLEELQARSNAIGDPVMAVWDALCEEAKAKVPEDEQMAVCPME